MIIGIPKELKNNERRVAITPAGTYHLAKDGNKVLVETNAGTGAGFSDQEYADAGAQIVTAAEAWAADMVIKVKEPEPEEYHFFHEGLILFTYLHLAPAVGAELTKALVDNKVVSIAYETVQRADRVLPLLQPMSEVAGRMAVQIGAQYLEKFSDGEGKGILLGGVPGVSRGKVVIVGGGIVGTNAAKIAVGLGADVTILDISADRLRDLDDIFGTSVNTVMSNPYNLAETVKDADLVVGCVLIPGAKAPKLVTEDMVATMPKNSVIVDVAIDQGGVVETSDHSTTHDDPIYIKHGVIHYAVANMPGAVPRTSTLALTNVTIPYAAKIAAKGYINACLEDEALLKGLNTLDGYVTFKAVADAHGYAFKDAHELLAETAHA
ncbi:alanine dehydrogenase [Sporolactobacillus spathodeae]|uniref:Alanine dehydrogenase n=1 Tax=Sporolactobacillus spathodeae TaxID=1465502 RepID=A0ABS2QAC4_9BACL|nr:alanine dehydrogenase [Sporolactobacillus spathodeae]MBM7657927.1 alanine dehydrogenase [Sporolactobacillus spathodeae]